MKSTHSTCPTTAVRTRTSSRAASLLVGRFVILRRLDAGLGLFGADVGDDGRDLVALERLRRHRPEVPVMRLGAELDGRVEGRVGVVARRVDRVEERGPGLGPFQIDPVAGRAGSLEEFLPLGYQLGIPARSGRSGVLLAAPT